MLRTLVPCNLQCCRDANSKASWLLFGSSFACQWRICRVKEGSYEASLKAGEEVVKLGAEHRIISLEWDKIPPPGKIHTLTRARRTNELLKLCTELDIKVLMFGHHQNDQTGNFARGNVHNVLMLASFPDHIHGLRMRLKSFVTGVGDPVYHVNRCGSVYCSV